MLIQPFAGTDWIRIFYMAHLKRPAHQTNDETRGRSFLVLQETLQNSSSFFLPDHIDDLVRERRTTDESQESTGFGECPEPPTSIRSHVPCRHEAPRRLLVSEKLP